MSPEKLEKLVNLVAQPSTNRHLLILQISPKRRMTIVAVSALLQAEINPEKENMKSCRPNGIGYRLSRRLGLYKGNRSRRRSTSWEIAEVS